MIYKTINQLPKEINLIKTNDPEFKKLEDYFFNLNILFKINCFNKIDETKTYFTLNPNFYFNNINKFKINLFIISVDSDNSHYFNLIKYIKTNNLKNIQYKKKFFKEFLYKNFPLKKPTNIVNIFLAYFNFRLTKYFITKKIWLPIILKAENTYKGYYIGLSTYNYYSKKDKKFNSLYKRVCQKLSDEKSKKIYKDTLYSSPRYVWRNYYDLLFQNEHYQDYLNFNNVDIINLGVLNGFEIPFMVTNNIRKIINVDPTGKKMLNDYVKSFIPYFKEKIFFDESYLYDSKNVAIDLNLDNFATDLKSLIKKYDCKKNFIIKSDIEGIEIKMLNELEEIVPIFRPQLAISIYHIDENFEPNNSHLVLIPNKLINICKKYKFYLNHYSYNRRETVFYCIPEEIL